MPRPDSRTGRVVEIDPFTFDLLLAVVESQRPYGGKWADITLVLALTGLRFGELRRASGARPGSSPVPGAGRQTICATVRADGGGDREVNPKSGRARIVPLSDPVRPTVEAWAEGRGLDDLLFPAPGGGYLHAQNWRRRVHWTRRASAAAARPSDTRRASLWIAAGIDIKTVSAWLGHSTAKLTLDTYGHLMGTDADRAALERVNRSFGGATGASKALPLTIGERPGGCNRPLTCINVGAPGQIRTADTRFRRAVLYPLSYEGGGAGARVPGYPSGEESPTTNAPHRRVRGVVRARRLRLRSCSALTSSRDLTISACWRCTTVRKPSDRSPSRPFSYSLTAWSSPVTAAPRTPDGRHRSRRP